MRTERPHAWSNPWCRWSVVSLAILTLASLLVGFVWLPAAKEDFGAQGLWASICRAAGVPYRWADASQPAGPSVQSTNVVLVRSMLRDAGSDSVGRGATLALNCTMCHGAQGMSGSIAPNLAGQYPEVVVKQLYDYKAGSRSNPIMSALAKTLSERDIADLGSYYSSLPKARTAPTTYDESLPALVRVGSPMRNIAPCISCHGGVDQKLGAPWIEGMPKEYLAAQIQAFRSGQRHNDPEAQMRNEARTMTDAEIEDVTIFYSSKASAREAR